MSCKTNIKLSKLYVHRPPTQTPINPPYKDAVDLKKQDQLAKPLNTLPELQNLQIDEEKS